MKIFINLALFILASASAFAQGITGKVVDENNTPLDFVNVVLINNSSVKFAYSIEYQ